MANVTGKGGFKKGKTGNPGGRPKTSGMPELIREKTNNGELLVAQALRVLLGEETTTIVNNTGEFVESPPTLKDKAEARQFLANRMDGTPKQSTEISGPDGGPVTIEIVRYSEGDQ